MHPNLRTRRGGLPKCKLCSARDDLPSFPAACDKLGNWNRSLALKDCWAENDVTSKSILIVEDEIMVAMDIERILVDAGYNVVAIASDKLQAISAGAKADAAFIDLNLRDGPTGPQIALELARQYGTKVVYVTANPAQIEEPASTSIGYIRKPFSDPAILAAAAMALEGLDADHEDLVRFPLSQSGLAPNPGSSL